MLRYYPTQQDCIDLLEDLVWNNQPKCHHCGSSELSEIEKYYKHSKNAYTCSDCRSVYTVTQKTIFHHTHLPIVKWFTAIHVIKTYECLPSSYKLAKLIGVCKTTGLKMRARILFDLESENSLANKIYQYNRQFELG